jgi:hypothetical protein
MNTNKIDYMAVYLKALAAAEQAEHEYREQHGEGFMCGFAWIHIPNGRDPFVYFLKKNNLGSKHWHKGYYLWNPSKCGSQSIDLLEHCCRVFAQVLKDNGIECRSQSRLD